MKDAAQGVAEDVPQDVAQDLAFGARTARAPSSPCQSRLCAARAEMGARLGFLFCLFRGCRAKRFCVHRYTAKAEGAVQRFLGNSFRTWRQVVQRFVMS